jgi:hypothetical protein
MTAGYRGLLVAFLASFLLVGVPYWRIPYNKVVLADAVAGVVLTAVAALVARLLLESRGGVLVVVVAAAVPAAVFARAVVDGMRDPTFHNLWPFEVAIAWMVGLAGAVAGALIGSVLRRVLGLRTSRN